MLFVESFVEILGSSTEGSESVHSLHRVAREKHIMHKTHEATSCLASGSKGAIDLAALIVENPVTEIAVSVAGCVNLAVALPKLAVISHEIHKGESRHDAIEKLKNDTHEITDDLARTFTHVVNYNLIDKKKATPEDYKKATDTKDSLYKLWFKTSKFDPEQRKGIYGGVYDSLTKLTRADAKKFAREKLLTTKKSGIHSVEEPDGEKIDSIVQLFKENLKQALQGKPISSESPSIAEVAIMLSLFAPKDKNDKPRIEAVTTLLAKLLSCVEEELTNKENKNKCVALVGATNVFIQELMVLTFTNREHRLLKEKRNVAVAQVPLVLAATAISAVLVAGTLGAAIPISVLAAKLSYDSIVALNLAMTIYKKLQSGPVSEIESLLTPDTIEKLSKLDLPHDLIYQLSKESNEECKKIKNDLLTTINNEIKECKTLDDNPIILLHSKLENEYLNRIKEDKEFINKLDEVLKITKNPIEVEYQMSNFVYKEGYNYKPSFIKIHDKFEVDKIREQKMVYVRFKTSNIQDSSLEHANNIIDGYTILKEKEKKLLELRQKIEDGWEQFSLNTKNLDQQEISDRFHAQMEMVANYSNNIDAFKNGLKESFEESKAKFIEFDNKMDGLKLKDKSLLVSDKELSPQEHKSGETVPEKELQIQQESNVRKITSNETNKIVSEESPLPSVIIPSPTDSNESLKAEDENIDKVNPVLVIETAALKEKSLIKKKNAEPEIIKKDEKKEQTDIIPTKNG